MSGMAGKMFHATNALFGPTFRRRQLGNKIDDKEGLLSKNQLKQEVEKPVARVPNLPGKAAPKAVLREGRDAQMKAGPGRLAP